MPKPVAAAEDLRNIEAYEAAGRTRYRVQISLRGQRQNETFDTLGEAIVWRDKVREARDGGDEPKRKRRRAKALSVAALIRDIYWPEYAKPELAESTRQNYYNHYRRWIVPSPLGAVDARRVNAEHVHEWHLWCRGRGASNPTIRTAQKVLSGAFAWAAQFPSRTGVESNPVDYAKWPEEVRSHKVHVFSPLTIAWVRQELLLGGGQQLGEDRELARERNALLFSVMALTGMRPVEARAVQLTNVGGKQINLDETKTNVPRSIPLLAPLASDIRSYAKAAGLSKTDFVCGQLDGSQMTFEGWQNWRNKNFKPAAERAAVRDDVDDARLKTARAYDVCRHSYAALMLQSQVPLARVAKQLGHSLETADRHYGELLAEYEGEKAIDPAKEVEKARKRVTAAAGAAAQNAD